jgi:hypothetical protein
MRKESFEQFIMKIINKYTPVLGLTNYLFEAVLNNKTTEYMACKFVYPYMNATIWFNDESLGDFKNGKDMEPFIVHELCHLITDPFYSKASQRYTTQTDLEHERERLTDCICNILLKKGKA